MSRRWVPNILTVINLFAGIVAIMAAFLHQREMAVLLIMAAALFDSVDGRIARRLNIASAGRKLDIFSDFVSFGVAPVTVAYFLDFVNIGINGCLLVAVFPLCGLVRLVKFNIFQVKGYYVGLPITFAGAVLAVWAYLAQSLPIIVQSTVMLVLAALMVLAVRVPKLWLGRRSVSKNNNAL
ncbi:MAG: pssA [Firmicutes bacterium]|nr:pssA [Bacillota bacterium]